MQVNIHEAKTHLSRLLERAEAGEEIVIAKAGKPIVRLTPCKEGAQAPRKPGSMKGKIKILPGFNKADQQIEALFHESELEPPAG